MQPIKHARDVSNLYARRDPLAVPQRKKIKRWPWQRAAEKPQPAPRFAQATRRVAAEEVETRPHALWHWLKVTTFTLGATCAALFGGYHGYFLAMQAGQQYPIKTVRVYGALHHIKPEHLRGQFIEALQNNFFQIDLQQMRADIEAMPWVHKASLRKEWPDTLIVHLTERVPVARWGDERLLGSDQSLFSRGEVDTVPALPLLSGADRDVPVVWSRYQALNAMLKPLQLEVSEIIMAERYSWRLVLSDGVEIVVDENDWKNKINRFVQFYQKIPASDRALLARADLRYDNGLAVKWKKKDDHPNAA